MADEAMITSTSRRAFLRAAVSAGAAGFAAPLAWAGQPPGLIVVEATHVSHETLSHNFDAEICMLSLDDPRPAVRQMLSALAARRRVAGETREVTAFIVEQLLRDTPYRIASNTGQRVPEYGDVRYVAWQVVSRYQPHSTGALRT